ncbi:hypothetical protein [Sphingopyxis granuli]|uniref:hypothetical protein n=1 Tax=Sphingopyxis granuli TaxID=267128 RepID=UPI001BAF93D1|nr:hypothetical protein [Sphingopyxis granuli]QUM74594.1 hypothetical protein ICN83_20705 [Sphingopyxis granuli]
MDQNIPPARSRARTQLRGPDLATAIAHAGSRVIYVDDDAKPIAAVLPIELWQMISKIPYYRAITESFGHPPTASDQCSSSAPR